MAPAKTVHVESDALKALKDAVYARYGRIHGVLCEEASQALRERAARLVELTASEKAPQEESS